MARKVCKICEKVFYTRASRLKEGRGKLCSKKCRHEWQKKAVLGKKSGLWKRGFHFRDGYKFVKVENHPFANNIGYIREHRFVMEKKLGRYLKPMEMVHHINGKKDDNRSTNLKIVVGQAEHSTYHTRKSECCDKKHYGRGMCSFHYHRWWSKHRN